MEMTARRWENTGAYLREVFGRQDEQLQTLMPRATAAGLPDIAVSADVGRLLMLLASMVGGDDTERPAVPGRPRDGVAQTGALAVELGTLAGYSTIWITRGLGPDGRLITVEPEPAHADFAAREFVRAGVAGQIEIRRGTALDVLPQLAREFGPRSIDLAFLDAVKIEYADYFRLLKPLIRPGGLLVADNALGAGSWCIDDPAGSSAERDAIDQFNRMVAADPEFTAACVPVREGVLIARRRPVP